MGRLLLKFDDAVLEEVPMGREPVTIGRAPDSDIRIDNLAVSSHHARIYAEAGSFMIEDLDSLNGTLVNGQRVKRITLRDGDTIAIGKHQILVDERNAAVVWASPQPKVQVPRMDETMVLDTKQRRQLLQQLGASGERSQIAPERVRMATLAVLDGKTDEKEYVLSSKLTVIGKSEMATVRLRGWFAPDVAAQVNRRDDGYYLGRARRVPRLNGKRISGPARLSHGDVIQVSGVRLRFVYRE